MATRKLISSGSRFEERIGYSRAVIDGDYVYVSGTTGYDYATMTIAGSVIEQAEQCFRNLAKVLEQAGSGFDQAVRVRYIYPERRDFEPCWPVFQKYLGESRPACTVIIAGLLEDAIKLEVEITARLYAAK